MNKANLSKYGLIIGLIAVSVAATTYLSLLGSDLLSSIYGDQRPSNQKELCEFLEEKLADKKLTNERLIKRYNKDKELHCANYDPDAPVRGTPPSGAALTNFLKGARSGTQIMANSNNLLDLLLPDRHKVKVNPETTQAEE